jgi:uncharacterized protein YjiS (DUF1127 family)
MAYATDAFKRLTGYPAEERRVRGASTGADGAMAYAQDIFARMRGARPDHPYDFAYHLHRLSACDDHGARGGGMPGTQAEWAVIYGKEVFSRLRGPEPLGSNHRQDEGRQHRRQHPSRSGGGLHDDGRRDLFMVSAAKTMSFCLSGLRAFAIAVGRAMMRLARRSILKPYIRRRRRRIAIAQLKALDNRLLADIGVRRNDIERIVDRLLASRDNTMSGRAALSSPTENRQHDRRLAA